MQDVGHWGRILHIGSCRASENVIGCYGTLKQLFCYHFYLTNLYPFSFFSMLINFLLSDDNVNLCSTLAVYWVVVGLLEWRDAYWIVWVMVGVRGTNCQHMAGMAPILHPRIFWHSGCFRSYFSDAVMSTKTKQWHFMSQFHRKGKSSLHIHLLHTWLTSNSWQLCSSLPMTSQHWNGLNKYQETWIKV